MSNYSLRYRMARRRALSDRPITQTLPSQVKKEGSDKPMEFQAATLSAFNPSSGMYTYKLKNGDYTQADYIPGYGAEFGGVQTGTTGLLSQGFWSR